MRTDYKLCVALAVAASCAWPAHTASATEPTPATPAKAAAKIPVVVDTDLGNEVGDALALGLLLASPEIDVRGVATVGGDAETRAWMACRLLTAVGRREAPVAWGSAPQPELLIAGQYQYRNHPAVLFGRTGKPVKEDAVELTKRLLTAEPRGLTIVALGPLTNIARLLDKHPDVKPLVKRIIWTGGSLNSAATAKMTPEANAQADIPAARAVIASGIPLTVVRAGAVANVKLAVPERERLFAAGTQLTYQIEALYQLGDETEPALADALAAALVIDERFAKTSGQHIAVDDAGQIRATEGTPNAQVVTDYKPVDFIKWFVDRVAAYGSPAPARPPGNRTQLVARGGLPLRVHAWEDYETDIERRWWMAGKAETRHAAPTSSRSCRGVLTLDFDDLQGDLSTNYRAVIFNPVPGPPMGPHTRLAFRYRLHGADTLRVQLYSLSNGYHRYLSVADLPQDEWREATVDMTRLRRPDGSGGPLAADERIDDIQFYVDPRAELLIDDIVLYELGDVVLNEQGGAATEPFPQRILYTGWFDTGAHGKEWPGDFEIVPHEKPRTWKAARSIKNPGNDASWIRLDLRGQRGLGPLAKLRFSYLLRGATNLEAALVDSRTDKQLVEKVPEVVADRWAQATVTFKKSDQRDTQPPSINEIRLLVPPGGELLIDDVLLYESGEAAQ